MGVQEGNNNSNEQNTPPKKNKRVTKDIIVKFIFGSVSQQRMFDWSDEQGYSASKGPKETVTNLVWSSPEGEGYTPDTENIIFVDCSSDVGWAYDSNTNKDYYINPRIFYAIEKIKTLLYRLSEKENMHGTVHCIILAYHPCEKHMFAVSNLFGNSLPEQGVYSSYISFINSKPEYKFSLRWIEEEYGWTFDVQYCGIFEAYDIMFIDKEGEEKKEFLFKLASDLHAVRAKVHAANKRGDKHELSEEEKAAIEEHYKNVSPDKVGWSLNAHGLPNKFGEDVDWGDPKYGTEYIDRDLRKWSDDPNYEPGKAPFSNSFDDRPAAGYHSVEPTINYRGENCTARDLVNKATGNYTSNEMRVQADKMEKAFDDKWDQRLKNLDEIDEKIEALKRQTRDETSEEYQEWEAIEKREKANAAQYKKENKYEDYRHHRRSEIDYHGAYRNQEDLERLRDNIVKKMEGEMREYQDLRKNADKKDAITRMQNEAGISAIIALLSIPFPPLAVVDIAFEIYKWQRDKDGWEEHVKSMGFDMLGVIPYVGGCIKLVKESRAVAKLAQAEAKVTQMGKLGVTAEKAAAQMENAAYAVSWGKKNSSALKGTIQESKSVISEAQGMIRANNEKVKKLSNQMNKFNRGTEAKIAENDKYIAIYEGYLKTTTNAKNRETLTNGINRLKNSNKALRTEMQANNSEWIGQIKKYREANRGLRQGIQAPINEQSTNTKLLQAFESFTSKAKETLIDSKKEYDAIKTLEKFQREVNALVGEGKVTLTGMSNITGMDIVKQITMGSVDGITKGTFVPKIINPYEWSNFAHSSEKLVQGADMASNAWAWKSAIENGYNSIDLSIAGSVIFENPEKMANFVGSQMQGIPPEALASINSDDPDMDDPNGDIIDLDLTMDDNIKRLMEERDISEDEAIIQLIQSNGITDEELNGIKVNDSTMVSETDNVWKILNGEYSEDVTENTPMTDEEIMEFKKNAEADKETEQAIQEELQDEIDKKKKQGSKDHSVDKAEKKYNEANGKLQDDRNEVQNHLDMLDYSLGNDEDGNPIITDPEERARLEAERKEWEAEQDNLNKPSWSRVPTGRYANDIRDEQQAGQNLSDAQSAHNNKYGTSELEKQKRESEERENQADIKIEKADQAIEAGNNSSAAGAHAEQATNDEDREDAEFEKRKNDIIRKNREKDIQSMQ